MRHGAATAYSVHLNPLGMLVRMYRDLRSAAPVGVAATPGATGARRSTHRTDA